MPVYNKIIGFIHIAFILIYCLLGIWFLTEETTLFEVPKIQQQILGGVFIVYSIYRSYRLYRTKGHNHQFTNSYEDETA